MRQPSIKKQEVTALKKIIRQILASAVILPAILTILSGCAQNNTSPSSEGPAETPDYILPAAQTERPDADTRNRIEKRCLEISEIYKDAFLAAQEERAHSDINVSRITKNDRQQITDILLRHDIAVLEPSEYNIDFLRSSDDFSSCLLYTSSSHASLQSPKAPEPVR